MLVDLWNVVLLTVAALCLLSALLKLIAITNAQIWLRPYGYVYTEAVKKLEMATQSSLSDMELYEIYEHSNANFFPFGLKDHKLRIFTNDRLVLDFLRKLLFTYPYLLTLMGVIVILYSTSAALDLSPRSFAKVAMGFISIQIVSLNISMIFEFLFGTVVMERYVRYFHVLDDARFFSSWRGKIPSVNMDLLRGTMMIAALFYGVFVTGISMTCHGALLRSSFIMANGGLDMLHYIQARADGSWLTWIIDAAMVITYYVTTTLSTTGYGDIYPAGNWGYLVAISLHVEQITLFVFAVAIFWATRSDKSDSRCHLPVREFL